jgi:radical SAM superfamily enzyme YgiQ (UPF0313 family)
MPAVETGIIRGMTTSQKISLPILNWLGRTGCRVRHRRCLHRPSQFCHGHSGPRAGSGRLSRRHCQPARLAIVRRLARFRPAAAVLRHQRGNMDSMINHYTANRKVRNDDAYSPGGRIGLRPDRATLAYCQRAREAYKGRAGDCRRRRSVAAPTGPLRLLERQGPPLDLLDCKADLVVFGMGEDAIWRSPRRLAAGETVRDLRDMRGVAYAWGESKRRRRCAGHTAQLRGGLADKWPSPKPRRSSTTKPIPTTLGGWCSGTIARRSSAIRPACPISQAAMDRIYGLPYTRRPHPRYREPIPAFEMIKDSVTIMRGCFGGCTFCSITAHQGRIIQSRSQESCWRNQAMTEDPQFKGVISDIGGPRPTCTR